MIPTLEIERESARLDAERENQREPQSQEVANTICSFARSTMLHYGYEGRIATAGNLAFPYSPSDFKVGAVYNFSLYHLIEVSDPVNLFKQTIVEL